MINYSLGISHHLSPYFPHAGVAIGQSGKCGSDFQDNDKKDSEMEFLPFLRSPYLSDSHFPLTCDDTEEKG